MKLNFGIQTLSMLVILLCLLAFSCKNEEKRISALDKETFSTPKTAKLKMDEVEKWIANTETQVGLERMDSLISDFKNQEFGDYQTLGHQLVKQTDYVIKNCTMQGEAHDELHAVLIPMLDQISILKEEKDASKSKKALTRLEQHIHAYFDHFKTQ